MTELFNRAAALSVGKNKTIGTRYAGFRVTFEIDKTSDSIPNPGKVTIYNLSSDSRAKFEEKNAVMILEAGYSGLGAAPILAQLFVGDIKRATTTRSGPDIVTTIEAGDEETKLRTTHIDQSFSNFTSAADVIKALASKLGVAVGTITTAAKDVFQNGVSLSGLVSDNLDNVTKKLGLEWSVTDGELNVLAPNKATSEPAVLVNKSTGLIGVPSKRQADDGKKGSFTGIEFASLLNTEIRPGRAIKLESEQITGIFRVRRARYRGDTHGGEWRVDVEAVQ